MLESILFFLGKCVMGLICIGIIITPAYLAGAFIYAIYKDFKQGLRSDTAPKQSR